MTFRSYIYCEDTYPQLDISGYKKYSYNYLTVDNISNIFQAQSMLGGYYAGGPWQERLKLKITGKLNEKLSVSYDLEQQPDMPDKYNVKVTYDKTELTFGDFNAVFGGNEFATTTKFLNGVMITSRDNWYDLTVVPSSKLKSYTQYLASQHGNNSIGPYNLGHGSIVEDSETVELNNVKLARGIDYSINYFEGSITFSRILSSQDEFKYTYEYTNIIDLFFPTVSKRDFIGLRTNATFDPTLWGTSLPGPEQSTKRSVEYFPSMLKIEVPEPKIIQNEITPEVKIKRSTEGVYQITEVLIGKNVIFKLYGPTGEVLSEKADQAASVISELIKNRTGTGEISIKESGGTFEIVAGDKTVIKADQTQAILQNTSIEVLSSSWKDNLIFGLSPTYEIETITVTPEVKIPGEFEWESTGAYKLKHYPIIPYSEVLRYNGRELKKLEDYSIDYNNGTINLFSPTLPTLMEPLEIEYKYIDVTEETESIQGAGFGPYNLKYKNIITGSESVLVNNIPYIRDLDYVIDYEKGTILFATNISQTSNIVIRYNHIVMVTLAPSPVQTVPQIWTVGTTYLKESGKSGATYPTATMQESFKGSDIIANNKTIYLSYRPLTSTDEVTVARNGIPVTYEVDYVIPTVDASTGDVIPPAKLAYINDKADRSDGLYTGTIKYLTTIESGDKITISYKYKKWSQERCNGSGSSGGRSYYLGSFRDLVPGAEIVQIWRKGVADPVIKTLTRNSSIETYDGHYSINYTNPPYLTFNSDPIVVDGETFYLDDINFTVIFKFVPTASLSQQDISHQVYGVDATFKYGNDLGIYGAVAKSETDQVYITISTNETFNGNGSSTTFNLASPKQIIEGSEQVYVNNRILNRDSHYYFFYNQNSAGKYGIITFYAVAPSSQDVISIDYSYQDTSGIPTSVDTKQGSAFKIGGNTKPFKDMELNAEYKKVEYDFAPLGSTSIPIGSDYKHVYSKLTPLSNFWIAGDYKESNNPIGTYEDKFLRSYDRNISGGFNPYGLSQIDFGIRIYDTYDDPLPGKDISNSDSQSNTYSLNITPPSFRSGEFAFSNRNEFRKTVSRSDIADEILPTDSTVDFAHTNNSFDFTSRVKWNLDYQVSESRTISYESGTAPVENKKSDDIGSNLNWDLTFDPIKRLYTYWNRRTHNEIDFINATTSTTLNETYHADLVPINQITTSINHDRQENLSAFTDLGNPKTERTTFNFRLTPYSNTALSWATSKDDSIQENGTITSGWSNIYTINHTPISESFYKLTTDYTLSISSRKAPFGSFSDVQTDTNSFLQSYGLTLNPIVNLTLTGGYIQENYLNKNDAPTSPIDTQSRSQTYKCGAAYKLTSDLDVSANYASKLTIIPTITPAPKLNVDAHAAYRLFTYGTLNYDWSREENQGEVLSGSFIDQDFIKTIQSLSLNIIVPQSGVTILSSITLQGAIKLAEFEDKKNKKNSFNATLITFEGALNF